MDIKKGYVVQGKKHHRKRSKLYFVLKIKQSEGVLITAKMVMYDEPCKDNYLKINDGRNDIYFKYDHFSIISLDSVDVFFYKIKHSREIASLIYEKHNEMKDK